MNEHELKKTLELIHLAFLETYKEIEALKADNAHFRERICTVSECIAIQMNKNQTLESELRDCRFKLVSKNECRNTDKIEPVQAEGRDEQSRL